MISYLLDPKLLSLNYFDAGYTNYKIKPIALLKAVRLEGRDFL